MLDKERVSQIVRTAVVQKLKQLGTNKFKEFKTINEVPELTIPLTDLLSSDFPQFVKEIDWVSPKPRSFRIILENDQYFYLTDLTRSWVAEIEGKKYYLLNLAESERASDAVSRLLRYAKPQEVAGGDFGGGGSDSGGFSGGGEANFPGSEPAGEIGGAEPAAEEAPEDLAPGFEEFEELPG